MVAQKLAVGNKTVTMSSGQKRRVTQKVEHLVNVLPPADVVVVRVLANRTIEIRRSMTSRSATSK